MVKPCQSCSHHALGERPPSVLPHPVVLTPATARKSHRATLETYRGEPRIHELYLPKMNNPWKFSYIMYIYIYHISYIIYIYTGKIYIYIHTPYIYIKILSCVYVCKKTIHKSILIPFWHLFYISCTPGNVSGSSTWRPYLPSSTMPSPHSWPPWGKHGTRYRKRTAGTPKVVVWR